MLKWNEITKIDVFFSFKFRNYERWTEQVGNRVQNATTRNTTWLNYAILRKFPFFFLLKCFGSLFGAFRARKSTWWKSFFKQKRSEKKTLKKWSGKLCHRNNIGKNLKSNNRKKLTNVALLALASTKMLYNVKYVYKAMYNTEVFTDQILIW